MTKFLALFLLVSTTLKSQVVQEIQSMSEALSLCSDHQFVVFGETHGIDVINKVRLESVQYHLQLGHTIHLLLERGKSTERAINNYITDKHIKYDPNLGLSKAFIDSLKVLNHQFPNKLQVHGIDIEKSLNLYIEELLTIAKFITDETLQEKILHLKSIETQNFTSNKSKKAFRKKIEKVVEGCAKYLLHSESKNNYLTDVIERGKASFYLSKKGIIKGFQFREEYMYENVQQLLKLYPNDFFYLQIGLNHANTYTDKKNWEGSLAWMLHNKPNSPVFKQVFAIGQGTVNCKSSRYKGIQTALANFPLQVNEEVSDYLTQQKNNKPALYIWQPKTINTFDLYLITVGYKEEESQTSANYLHLLFN